jgi:hypothetical protein
LYTESVFLWPFNCPTIKGFGRIVEEEEEKARGASTVITLTRTHHHKERSQSPVNLY